MPVDVPAVAGAVGAIELSDGSVAVLATPGAMAEFTGDALTVPDAGGTAAGGSGAGSPAILGAHEVNTNRTHVVQEASQSLIFSSSKAKADRPDANA
jgi:hypothetical protein